MSAFLPCRETVDLLTGYQDGALPWLRALQVRLHLARCPDCARLAAELHQLPSFLALLAEPAERIAPPPGGEAALAWALEHAGEPHTPRPDPAGPVPKPIQGLLDSTADLPLRLMAHAHRALFEEARDPEAPYLPGSLMDRLPPREQWHWKRLPFTGLHFTALAEGKGGERLLLLEAPSACRTPRHVHRGSENMLVLDGDVWDGGHRYGPGEWIHYNPGSIHAPSIGPDGCHCLLRLEATGLFYTGFLGRLRNAAV